MSEEEKKVYEELKKEINKPLEVPEDKCNTFILYNIDNAKIIVNLIKKQQKKIDELKKYEKYYEEMEEVNKKFISVDKIREKIEEYKKPKKFKEVDEYGEIIEGEIIYKDIVEALKKLLKEE